MKRIRTVPILLLFAAQFLMSAEKYTTGADFLLLKTAAGPDALAGAMSAREADLAGLEYNIASLGAMKARSVSVSYSPYIAGSNLAGLLLAYPLSYGAMGFSYTGFYSEDTYRDERGLVGREFLYRNSLMRFAYAVKAGKKISAGFSINRFSENIAESDSSGFAFDAGLIVRAGESPVNFAGYVKNISFGKTGFNKKIFEPAFTAAIGSGLDLNPFFVLFDAVYSGGAGFDKLSKNTVIAIGAEYRYKILSVRAGFKTPDGISAGIGFDIKSYRLDYSLDFLSLEYLHRFSVSIDF